MCVYVFDKASLHQAFVQVALLLVAFFCVHFVFQKAFFCPRKHNDNNYKYYKSNSRTTTTTN